MNQTIRKKPVVLIVAFNNCRPKNQFSLHLGIAHCYNRNNTGKYNNSKCNGHPLIFAEDN